MAREQYSLDLGVVKAFTGELTAADMLKDDQGLPMEKGWGWLWQLGQHVVMKCVCEEQQVI